MSVRARSRADMAVRDDMAELERYMLGYAEMLGAEREAAIARRHIATIESGEPFRCRADDLPTGYDFRLYLRDDEPVVVEADGSVTVLDE